MNEKAAEMDNSVSDFFVNSSSVNNTSSDKSSILSIPSCLWLPQGPIIKSPCIPQQTAQNETHINNQASQSITEQEISENTAEEFSGFSEFSTNGSAIEREQKVSDKFNGILYHVIPTYNQINILFSTQGLYSKFVNSLDKELHSRTQNKDNPIYQTHLQGKKCILTCKKSESSILVTGPGKSIWRETTFLRLSIGLFQTFASENEAGKQFQCHSSTPAEPRHQHHNILPLSPIDFGKSASSCEPQSSQPTLNDINRQLNFLCEMTKNLQGQIHKINEVMCQLIQKADYVHKNKTVQEHVILEPCVDNHSEVVTINDTMSESKTVPGTSTYSEVLRNNEPLQQPPIQKRNNKANQPKDMDKNKKQSKSAKTSSDKLVNSGISQTQPVSRTLFIGDSILSGIHQKGLKSKVDCQAIPGATIDILLEKVPIYDLKSFQNIIIYVSGNDASQNTEIEYAEEKYEQLICMIKEKNPEIKIYLCSICPRGDTCVNEVNDLIKRQSEVHGCIFIDIHKTFYNKQNQLKSHFYKLRDNIHLSASGTRGLLGCIHQHVHIVENFQQCAYTGPRTQNDKRSHSRQTESMPHTFSSMNSNRESMPHTVSPRNSKRESMPHAFSSRNQKRRKEQISGNIQRCFKCGLTNHETYKCHHKQQLQCYSCKFWGHRDSVCWNV